MNIFAIDEHPRSAAEQMTNNHVNKMILESAQILSTAHRVLDGFVYVGTTKFNRNIKRWGMRDRKKEMALYIATHISHPSVVWCRRTKGNYLWLFDHYCALMQEYTHRYGKHHACEKLMDYLRDPPQNIPDLPLEPFAVCMPPEYIVSDDPVENYRNYYKHGKAHLHKWTNREKPNWIS